MYPNAVLPYDAKAESSVLGAILLDPSLVWHVVGMLQEKHFHVGENRAVMGAIMSCVTSRIVADDIAVLDKLRGKTEPQNGWETYLRQLMANCGNPSGIETHAQIVLNLATRREMVRVGSAITGMALDQTGDVSQQLATAQSDMMEIANHGNGSKTQNSQQWGESYLKRFEERIENPRDLSGISTGLVDYDRLMGGRLKGKLHIIAARPGMGKSSMCVCEVAHHLRHGRSGIVFLPEMNEIEFMDRFVSHWLQIPYNSHGKPSILKPWLLSDQQRDRVRQVVGRLQASDRIHITAGSSMNALQIASESMRITSMQSDKNPIDFIMVDHIHRMRHPFKLPRLDQQIGESVKVLTDLFKNLDVVGVVAAQLRRSKNFQLEPSLEDLRESGQLEEDASTVTFISREGYDVANADEFATQTTGKLIVAKNRDGAVGQVRFYWDAETMTLKNLEFEKTVHL